MTLKHVY